MPVDLKRALKDKAYLDSLSKAELKECMDLIAGAQELGDEELDRVAGGMKVKDKCKPRSEGPPSIISC